MAYTQTVLNLIDHRQFNFINEQKVIYSCPLMYNRELNYYNLKTGKLIVDLKKFNGIMFLDNYKNFYDTFTKKIYFNNSTYFEGELDKEAFSLFDNYNKLELKIREAIDNIKNDEIVGKLIENIICDEIKKEFEDFNLNKVLLKNGKFFNSIGYCYCYIHDNFCEFYPNNEKFEFIQEIKNNVILTIPFGKIEYFNNVLEYQEYFYGYFIGRFKSKNDSKERFGFRYDFKEVIKDLIIKDDISKYKIGNDERISLEIINNKTELVKIFIKDPKNINIIYEIITKMNDENELDEKSIVIDHRTGEMLLINNIYDNIISNDIFDDFPDFFDETEFTEYKNNLKENINNLKDAKKLIEKKSTIKNKILKIKEIVNNDDSIEKIAQEINKDISNEKIKHNGIKDQKHSGECWVYALSKIIADTNARKYGRKLDDFNNIYNTIIKKYSKDGKNAYELENIMRAELKNYDLKYTVIGDENTLKCYLRKGIRILTSFCLNEKEWEIFSHFSDNFKEGQVLTQQILEQQNYGYMKNIYKISGHVSILFDIDEQGNYALLNSWGKNWGNNGTFKVKRECLKGSAFFAVYFDDNTEEEKNALNKLKSDIKELLNELNVIICPKCRRCAKIEQFEIANKSHCMLRCPYPEKCILEFNNEENMLEFFVNQLIYYNPYDEEGGIDRFDYGF